MTTPNEEHEFDRETDAAFEALSDLHDRAEEDDLNPVGVGFSLWIGLLITLLGAGWTRDDLIKEVEYYSRRNMN